MWGKGLVIVFVIVIIYAIYILSTHKYPTICLTKALKELKTGDLILFKAKDNYNSIVTGYFTHIGVVVEAQHISKSNDVEFYIFEAKTVANAPTVHDSKAARGIFLEPLIPRLTHYKGEVYVRKPKKKPEITDKFKNFIEYALAEMYYEDRVIVNAVKKILGEPLHKGTNCGELAYATSVSLKTIPDTIAMNHLSYMCYSDLYNQTTHLAMDEYLSCLTTGKCDHA